MCEESTFAHSRSVEAPDLRGTGAHHLSDDAIRAAETAQMLSHTKLMMNWGSTSFTYMGYNEKKRSNAHI